MKTLRKCITALPEGQRGITDMAGEHVGYLPRYAVWETDASGKTQVIDVGDDLNALAARNNMEPKAFDLGTK